MHAQIGLKRVCNENKVAKHLMSHLLAEFDSLHAIRYFKWSKFDIGHYALSGFPLAKIGHQSSTQR